MIDSGLAPGRPPVLDEPTRFALPLAEPSRIYQVVGLDHDPEVHPEGLASAICTDYEGRNFPWCYDEHDGTDYLLDGGFEAMDAGSSEIVAAADGIVVETADGNYDRCHATLEGVDCDGYEMSANYVIIEHDDGLRSMYWHMKTGSVLVEEGQSVTCGEPLGLIGSSGNSSMPHLHFEVQDIDGEAFDPYSGPESQDESWWLTQGSPYELPEAVCEAG